MKSSIAPQKIITLSALFLLVVIALSSVLATSVPWLGLSLTTGPGDVGLIVQSVDPDGPAAELVRTGDHLVHLQGSQINLSGIDLKEEPDSYALYSDYNEFFDRQSQLFDAVNRPVIGLQMADGRTVSLAAGGERPLTDLPLIYWYQLACGAIVFLAGMSVLAFRTSEKVTLYYAMSGLGLLLASASAAIYSTRELALPGEMFYYLSLLNQFGTFLFAGTFISILWYYPQRIHPFPLGPLAIAGYFISWLLNVFQVYDSLDVAMRYPLFIGLALNLTFALTQWRLSRNHPVHRAILKWFLLAWLSGSTLYLGLYTIPLVLNMETLISQSLGWGILLTVYVGIALGISRYRLFNLDRWVLIGWLWFLGGAAVIAVDVLLVSLLDLDSHLALATTLAVAGWLYFPLRQHLLARLSGYYGQGVDYRDLIPSLLKTVLNTHPHELPREWRSLLERIFSPLNAQEVEHSPEQAVIHPEGSSLTIPAFYNVPALELNYAERGNRLFNENDRRLAEAVHQLFSRVQRFREAFNEGVHVERRRVARDLHDDVGAKLLTLIYTADNEQHAVLARETLQELRDVIRDLEHKDYALLSTLSMLKQETGRRCESHGVELVWNQSELLPDRALESRQHSNVQRMVREAVTNALRHSKADRLQIDVDINAEGWLLQVSNNNVQQGVEAFKPGRGMHNIRSRAQELGGTAEWIMGDVTSTDDLTVRITLPLETKVKNA